MGSYLRPSDLYEALQALATKPRAIVAGGTDYYPVRVGRPLDDDVLDITALPELRAIADQGDHTRIPALATWTDLIETPLPAHFAALKLAAREVGGVQIQNAGTLCGNLCNASPAADGVPPLLAVDASVELTSQAGRRILPLRDFILGNRRTALAANEIMTAILVPKPARPARSTFLKLGARKYLVISIVMVAVAIEETPDHRLAAARVAVGACSAAAQRLPELEAALAGKPIDARLGDVATDAHLGPLMPIDDIRATAAYRRDAALTLLRRSLASFAAPAGATP